MRSSMLLTVLLMCASTASAQSNVCWRARPLANCKTWLITETAVARAIGSGRLVAAHSENSWIFGVSRFALTGGAMVNIGTDQAVGFTGASTGGMGLSRMEARYRRWLNDRHGLDASAGLATGRFKGDFNYSLLGAEGVTASVGVSNTYIGADLRVDVVRTRHEDVIHGTYLSIRAGSRAGPITMALGLVAAVIVFSGVGT